ncbi:sulfotransferase family protein [Sphingomonas sp. GCM10030256]|uniref:sulfotransferase family protein n=1 Tax=Sphingomonas sp. GCM10030256 TaxID=3273427 RepID=UPI00361370E9
MTGRPPLNPLPAVSALNRSLAFLWARGWWQEPRLDLRDLEAEALRLEGAAEISPGEWRERLALLLDDLRDQAELNPLGRAMAHGQLVGLLRARIRAERLLARNPEIHRRAIPAPVVIVGPMRSGTTRLHRLLACDSAFAHTRLFESLEPVPRRGRLLPRRLLRTAAVTTFLRAINPDSHTIHPSGPMQPEEEFGLAAFSFHGTQLEAQWRVPRFAHFCETRCPAEAYGEFATLLRIIGWSRGDPDQRTWLLKSPQFMADLDTLLDVLPGARLLCLERDPAAVVGSSASLVWNQQRVQSDAADPRWIGREWLRKSVDRARRTAVVRAERPDVPQLDVRFDAVSADWEGEIRRIYAFLDRPLAPAVLARMRRYMRGASAHRGHRYALDEFGLSAEQVRQAFQTVSASGEGQVHAPGTIPSSWLPACRRARRLG